MSDKTGIGWTDATFNPWWGCAKVSPGCDNCYAERDAGRFFPAAKLWGANAPRRLFDGSDSKTHWRSPWRWNKRAEQEGRRMRVFCASMADVFDNSSAVVDERFRLWEVIRRTPNLDWQLLTKRIGNVPSMLPPDWGNGFPNVWLGASVVNQGEADRDIPKLLAIPARVRFVSCEPLLAPIAIGIYLTRTKLFGRLIPGFQDPLPGLDWVIVGGESGNRARPFDLSWARLIVAQCGAAQVPCFMKQLGARPYDSQFALSSDECIDSMVARMHDSIRHRSGADPMEWPSDLRVQEFPQ